MTHPHLRPTVREIVGTVCAVIIGLVVAVAAGLFVGALVATLTGSDVAGFITWPVVTLLVGGLMWGSTE